MMKEKLQIIEPGGCIFWNVDTQFDFVSPLGKLYVPGAEMLKPRWKELSNLAREKAIRVVNTADFHYANSSELSQIPNFVNTFPEHCMANSAGADFIEETNPDFPVVFDWDKPCSSVSDLINTNTNIVIRKDAFDVFNGNPYTNEVVRILGPKTVVVYGVTTNVCVNDAVVGLAARVNRILVVADAIKELPGLPLPYKIWEDLGVQMLSFDELSTLF